MLGNRTSLFFFSWSGRGRPMTTFKVTHWSELFSCIRWTAAWSEDLCIPCCQILQGVCLTVKSYLTQTFSYVIILMFLTENWTQIFQKSNLRWPSHFQRRRPHPKEKRVQILFLLSVLFNVRSPPAAVFKTPLILQTGSCWWTHLSEYNLLQDQRLTFWWEMWKGKRM